MKRLIFPFIIISLFVFGIVVSCEEFEKIRSEMDNTIQTFEFGHYEDMRSGMMKVADFLSFKQGDKTFISFMSEEDLEDIRSGKGSQFLNPNNQETKELMDTSNYRESPLEFQKKAVLSVMTTPFNAPILDIEIDNHTPELISFSVDPDDKKNVQVEMHDLGLASFDVTVTGLGFKQTKSYKIRIIATVKSKFIVSNRFVSKSQLGCRIWCMFTNVPEKAFPMVVSITDSVALSSYTEYYNFSKFGRTMKIYTEQRSMPMEENIYVPFFGEIFMVRDLTLDLYKLQGIHYFIMLPRLGQIGWYVNPTVPPVYRGIWGEKEVLINGERNYIPYYYPIEVDQIKLFWTIYCDNPFIEFEGSTFTFWAKDKSEFRLKDDYVPADSLAVADTIPSGVTSLRYDNIDELVEETNVSYFDLQIAKILSRRAQDSLSNALDQWKTRLGFDKVVDDGNFAKRDSLLNEAKNGGSDFNM